MGHLRGDGLSPSVAQVEITGVKNSQGTLQSKMNFLLANQQRPSRSKFQRQPTPRPLSTANVKVFVPKADGEAAQGPTTQETPLSKSAQEHHASQRYHHTHGRQGSTGT